MLFAPLEFAYVKLGTWRPWQGAAVAVVSERALKAVLRFVGVSGEGEGREAAVQRRSGERGAAERAEEVVLVVDGMERERESLGLAERSILMVV